jgi:uncharacterized protein
VSASVPEKTPPPPLVTYPGPYAFKVMGRPDHGFREHVRGLFSRVLGSEVGDDSISETASRQGKYVSLTVSVVLTSEAQRQNLYRHLHAESRVLYYL